MRKLLLILVLVFAAAGAKAQVRSLGLTLGSYEAVTFQHWVYGTDNVFQLDFGYHTGLPSDGAWKLMGSYNIMLLSPTLTIDGDWNFYAGPGGYLGAGWAPGKGLTFGVMAVVGLEYLFEYIPLQMSVDIRPGIGTVLTNNKYVFDKDALLGFVPSVSLRYMF